MTAMLATARSRGVLLLSRRARISVNRSYASSVSDRKELPNSAQSKNDPNISKANELPVQTHDLDQLLPESVQETERFSLMQAPNRVSIWSRSQNPRQGAMSGPRFEQTTLKLQV
jgi:NADH dehydrogenase (ubiquinone) Fe-S protein 6